MTHSLCFTLTSSYVSSWNLVASCYSSQTLYTLRASLCSCSVVRNKASNSRVDCFLSFLSPAKGRLLAVQCWGCVSVLSEDAQCAVTSGKESDMGKARLHVVMLVVVCSWKKLRGDLITFC